MLRGLLLNQPNMVWEERYITLLWLSHIVLTPFDLQSVSSPTEDLFTQAPLPKELNRQNLPVIAGGLVSAGLRNLIVAGKERESASLLLVRIALRPDMQRQGLLDDLVKLMIIKLHDYTQKQTGSMYECLGYLSVLLGVVKTGSADDVFSFLTTTFDFALKAMTAESADSSMIRGSAPARKILIAILRTSTLHAIALNSRGGASVISGDAFYGMLEGTIQYLLEALGDRETPVRLAASKALSMLADRLDEDMKVEVIQAIMDTLEQDVLYEDSDSGDPMILRLSTKEDMQKMSRNVTAVNPLRWQGLFLTLGHLLLRRTALPDQLSSILKSLLSGLDFEQRSAGGTSIGGSVRDAACFGLWSLARKYATSELQSVDPASALQSWKLTSHTTEQTSILQVVAEQLVVSACLDPSGNIRRGSSAALQELIGRHPDTIVQGIALVQVVDYHAVARRSKAMLDVARGAAELADVYRSALSNALFGWRGVRAVDDDSRRTAAEAMGELISSGAFQDRYTALKKAQILLSRLPAQNTKSIVESRHGLLMTISRILDSTDAADLANLDSAGDSSNGSLLQNLWEGLRREGPILGSLNGSFIPELILEAAAGLLSSLVRAVPAVVLKSPERVIEILDICLTRAEHDFALVTSADTAFELLSRLPVLQTVDLVRGWLNSKEQGHNSFSSKGRILALGAVFVTLPEDHAAKSLKTEEYCRTRVFAQLADFIQGHWHIETQVIALRSLTSTIPHLGEENVVTLLGAALDNYANDQRGDVGSLVRSEAIKVVSALVKEIALGRRTMLKPHPMQSIIQKLFRLAGEKLDKLRFEAWTCIAALLTVLEIRPAHK